MAFKDILIKFRRAFSCCGNRDRKLLNIGVPTDVRRVDISESLPGLTDTERKYIKEKASSDAIHLLGLQSHPPSMPPTTAPTPVRDRSPSLGPNSVVSSREPSEALLNAASKDLPSSLPTPPKRHHNENSPPSARMKSMWDNARRTSAGSGHHDQLYEKLEQFQGTQQQPPHDGFTMLSLNFEDDKKGTDTPRTLSLTDITEGFEMQNITGGHSHMPSPTQKIQVAKRTTRAPKLEESGSDSEADLRPKHENVAFVKI